MELLDDDIAADTVAVDDDCSHKTVDSSSCAIQDGSICCSNGNDSCNRDKTAGNDFGSDDRDSSDAEFLGEMNDRDRIRSDDNCSNGLANSTKASAGLDYRFEGHILHALQLLPASS